jgi:D-aminopeptidase
MQSALLAADTRAMPDGTEGYEGTPASGFRAVENRIVWTGDAGLGASLDDMIAWERHIDATRDDAGSLYGRLCAPVVFADGTPATYGFGLGRRTEHARHVTGHGGALRGWRSHRMYVAAERVSVVVLFNHMADARMAAMDLLAAGLGEQAASEGEVPPTPDWTGAYVEPETGLAVRTDPHAPGRVRLRFGHTPEVLTLRPDGSASSDGVTLRPEPAGLVMERADEHLSSLLQPRAGEASSDIAGRYRNAELDAELRIEDAGGVLYGAFAGFLGAARMEMLDAIGPDLWALPCPRALDHTPPGDWTLAIRRDGTDRPLAVEVGCWLARGLTYERC